MHRRGFSRRLFSYSFWLSACGTSEPPRPFSLRQFLADETRPPDLRRGQARADALGSIWVALATLRPRAIRARRAVGTVTRFSQPTRGR